MSDLFVKKTQAVLGKVLDGAAARQRVLASNIANVETPGYIRKDLHFESALRNAIDDASQDTVKQLASIEKLDLKPTDDKLTPTDDQGNNVEIDHEMVELAKNSLQYDTAAQLLIMEMRQLKNAIHEGRR